MLGTIAQPATAVLWVLVAILIRSMPDVLERPVECWKNLSINFYTREAFTQRTLRGFFG